MITKNYILQFLFLIFISVFISTNTEAQSPNLAWANSLDNGITSAGSSTATTMDKDGNVYKTGYARGSIAYNGQILFSALGQLSSFIIKIDPAGNIIWAKQIGYKNAEIESQGIAVSNSGSVYIVGSFRMTVDFDPDSNSSHLVTAVGKMDAFLCKLDAVGDFKWVKTWSNSVTDHVEIGPSKTLYITGSFNNSLDLNPGAGTDIAHETVATQTERFVCKLDSTGNYIWGQHFQDGVIYNGDRKLSLGLEVGS